MYKILFTIILFLFFKIVNGQSLYDLEIVKKKLYSLDLQHALIVDASLDKPLKDFIKSMDTSGKWPDINYKDKTVSKWLPSYHWRRLLELSIQYRDPKSTYFGDVFLHNEIIKGIKFWLINTPESSNYWWNAIGIPNLMGAVYVLMEGELSDSLKVQGIRLIKLGVKPDHYEYYGKATGQNLLWLASAHLYAACISKNVDDAKRVFAAVADEIKITEDEGIQADFSFYQHGKQNYALGYGKGFTASAVRFFYLANATVFQLSKDKVDIVANYLLNGQQWMTRYSYLEYTAMGREIARQKIDRQPLLNALKWMATIDTLHYQEYELFYSRLSGIKVKKPLLGNRYFSRSDLMIHQRPNYYFSLKATSNRIASGESGNGENLKGFYQGNGTYYLIRNGNEYQNIFPIWDWRKLPGLLSKQTTDSFQLFTWGAGSEGKTAFVYGISDSMYGCFGYDYDKDNVKAHRSWFFFDNEIVHLASGISGDSVYQSINQSLLNGNLWSNNSIENNSNSQMVFHDSVGYCIGGNGNKLALKTSSQTGSWQQINIAASDSFISKKVFSLGINFGQKVTDASCYYAIIPAISLAKFKKYQLSNHIEILKNSETLQAVYQKDIEQVQAVYYAKGKLFLPWNNLSIDMKNAGLVLIKKENNKLTIDYSQPPSIKKHLEMEINQHLYFNNDDVVIKN